MKRLSFPRFGVSAGKPRASRGWTFYLGALGALLAGFVLGLTLFFPTAILQNRIEHEVATRTPVRVDFEDLSLLFPPGLGSRTLTVKLPLPEERVLSFDTLSLRPLWHTLFTPRPGIVLRSRFQGGDIELSARNGGAVEGHLQQIPFAEPLLPGSALQISGTLDNADLLSAIPLQAETVSTLSLRLGGVRLAGLKGVGAETDTLSLGTLTLEGNGKGTALKIDQLEGTGGDLALSGSGTLLLATPLQRSRLNLSLTLKPGPQVDRALLDLLGLLVQPGRDGTFRLRLSGTLAAPALR